MSLTRSSEDRAAPKKPLQMCTGVAYCYSPAGDRSLEHITGNFAGRRPGDGRRPKVNPSEEEDSKK